MTYESKITNEAGQHQLDLVAAEFDNWRHHKTRRAERIPSALLHEAQKLSEYLGATTVQRRLGITKGQMDKFNGIVKPPAATGVADFMQLVPVDSSTAPGHSDLTVDICLPSGVKLSLSGLTQNDPLALIAKLIER